MQKRKRKKKQKVRDLDTLFKVPLSWKIWQCTWSQTSLKSHIQNYTFFQRHIYQAVAKNKKQGVIRESRYVINMDLKRQIKKFLMLKTNIHKKDVQNCYTYTQSHRKIFIKNYSRDNGKKKKHTNNKWF